MRKTIILTLFAAALFIAVLAACSGYFNNQNNNVDSGADFLALADGSGYLSSDSYNEITPFVYHEGGKAWLFFASDRPGGSSGYDIYFAEMDSAGKFSKPVMMDTNINTISNEISPVVYKWYYGGSTNTYISFIRTLGNSTNIITYKLNSSLQTAGFQQAFSNLSAIQIGLLDTGNLFSNMLLISDGTVVVKEYFDYGTGFVTWSLTSNITIASPVQSANGYQIPVGPIQCYISGSGSLLLAGFAIDQNQNIKYLDFSGYSSGYHDIQPFVDTADGYKIYFASDRYGKGNYDLYRYNTKTFDNVVGNLGKSLDAPVLDLGDISFWLGNPQLNWSVVLGADGYEVYRYTNSASIMPTGPADYTKIANVSITNYPDYDGNVFLMNGQLWYMVVATNSTMRSGYSAPQGNLHHYTN